MNPVNGPERWMTIRVYGSLLHTVGAWHMDPAPAGSAPRQFAVDDIDAWMRQCADRGATAVLWQANNGGLWTHPSPVFPLAGPPCREHNEAYTEVWGFLGEQVRRFDNLTVAIDRCHAHGLRFVYGFCPWDFVDSPFEASVFHPDLWVLSRRGEPFHGVPCYADERVQRLVLAHLVDVLDRGVDDLALSPFSHLQAHGLDQPGYYGFNAPLVAAYQARHGRDPRLFLGPPPGLAAVHGDLFTGFLRQLHGETARRGQRLIPFSPADGHWGWGGAGGGQLLGHVSNGQPPPSAAPACSIQFPWRQWVAEGLADALLLLAAPQDAVATAGHLAAETNLPLLLWHKTASSAGAGLWSQYLDEAAAVRQGSLHGYVVHATALGTQGPQLERLWQLLAAGR